MKKRATSVINIDPEILGGMPVFYGTRVPIKNLFDYLEAGHSIEVFIDEFPSVKRKQVISVLAIAERLLQEIKMNENSSRRVLA